MDQIYPDEGLIPALLAQVRGQTGGALVWDLFTTPIGHANVGMTYLSLSLCSTAGSFAAISVPAGRFFIQSVNGHVGVIQAPPISFLNIAGISVLVQGYAIYDSFTKLLEGLAFFDRPINVPADGSVQVTPALGAFSGLTS